MSKSHYIPLICGDCDLHFAILKKHYEPKDRYLCPICGRDRIVTPDDLKPPKKFGRAKKVQPTINPRED